MSKIIGSRDIISDVYVDELLDNLKNAFVVTNVSETWNNVDFEDMLINQICDVSSLMDIMKNCDDNLFKDVVVVIEKLDGVDLVNFMYRFCDLIKNINNNSIVSVVCNYILYIFLIFFKKIENDFLFYLYLEKNYTNLLNLDSNKYNNLNQKFNNQYNISSEYNYYKLFTIGTTIFKEEDRMKTFF